MTPSLLSLISSFVSSENAADRIGAMLATARAGGERRQGGIEVGARKSQVIYGGPEPTTIIRAIAELGVGIADACIAQHLEHPPGEWRSAVDVVPRLKDHHEALRDAIRSVGFLLRADPAVRIHHVVDEELLTVAGHAGRIMLEVGVRHALVAPLTADGEQVGTIAFFFVSPITPEASVVLELVECAGQALAYGRSIDRLSNALRCRTDLLAATCHDLATPISAIRLGVATVSRMIRSNDL